MREVRVVVGLVLARAVVLGGTGGYIYNLRTKGLGTGTYELRFTAGGSPTVHALRFEVRN